jgi:O-antigen biosynthesis alpha-1,3-mannosyltransferase
MRKVAVVHDWLVTWGGSERVLEQMLRVYPEADVFAIVEGLDPERRQVLAGRQLTTSFIQRLPGAKRHFWYYAGLMPIAVEQFDLSDYDIVLSSSHAAALGAITGPDQLHIAYLHSPLRFVWDLQPMYLDLFGFTNGLKGMLARLTFHYLRVWDRSASHGVDRFLANSRFVARRIEKTYRRPSTVVYPPVDTRRFALTREKEDYFLAGSRLNPFKRLDLVVEAFKSLPDQRLVVVGEGPHLETVRGLAASNVEFVGQLSDEQFTARLARAKAFVHAAKEDFGIAMAEALASAAPPRSCATSINPSPPACSFDR